MVITVPELIIVLHFKLYLLIDRVEYVVQSLTQHYSISKNDD